MALMAKYDHGGGCACGLYKECEPGCESYVEKKMSVTSNNCELCGEPLPENERMFRYHGYCGPCPVKKPVEIVKFKSLREANAARQLEWDSGGKLDGLFKATELGGEVGEALNVVKKLERERMGLPGSRDTIEHLGQELADVLICVELLASYYGINVDEYVAKKFNATSEARGLKTMMEV